MYHPKSSSLDHRGLELVLTDEKPLQTRTMVADVELGEADLRNVQPFKSIRTELPEICCGFVAKFCAVKIQMPKIGFRVEEGGESLWEVSPGKIQSGEVREEWHRRWMDFELLVETKVSFDKVVPEDGWNKD